MYFYLALLKSWVSECPLSGHPLSEPSHCAVRKPKLHGEAVCMSSGLS